MPEKDDHSSILPRGEVRGKGPITWSSKEIRERIEKSRKGTSSVDEVEATASETLESTIFGSGYKRPVAMEFDVLRDLIKETSTFEKAATLHLTDRPLAAPNNELDIDNVHSIRYGQQVIEDNERMSEEEIGR